MTFLIVDTSTDLCLIALANGGQILAQRAFPHLNLLSRNLLPAIQELLKENGLHLSALSFIAAGIGPGSYTGTRLGAAVAKSLSFGLNIKVKPFHSPLAFLPPREGCFAFLLPTRAGLYFVLNGSHGSHRLDQKSAGIVSAEELAARVEAADFLICPASQSLPENLKERPLFPSSPNLSALVKFLADAEALPPENVELQYLHTPF